MTDPSTAASSPANGTPAVAPRSAPLEGVLVADFSRVLAGPYASMFLADFGAEVIKIERPGAGDDTRSWGPPWTPVASSYYESMNRTKQSVTLDLYNAEDLAIARTIAERADVLVENFMSGTMERFGLDYATLREVNPGLVYASVTGFGSSGGAALPGYDFLVQAVGGLMSITGEPDGQPLKVGVALVDVMTGKDAAIGILAALRAKEVTGLGQRIEVNLLSTILGALVNQASGALASGVAPGRMGNRHPSVVPYETIQCSDVPLAVACGNDGQFRRFMQVLGLPELITDERFATPSARVDHRDELIAEMGRVLSTNTAAYWEEAFTRAGLAAGRIGNILEAIDRARALGLDPTYEVGEGRPPQVRNPILFSDHTPRRDMPPPRLGEHDTVIRARFAPASATQATQDTP